MRGVHDLAARRKCDLDCPLAPYLPADQQSRFTKAQRLFGTSNIQKTLTKYGPAAMRSLMYQSEARAADPSAAASASYKNCGDRSATLRWSSSLLDSRSPSVDSTRPPRTVADSPTRRRRR
ncbi:LOB domain-containing protein 22-like [Miscanthus floridulus]|uniref:LOB domain-containing protein 22-like n=1 Tax=Miscanthus floridulus TaxID=154761 RepID=UPI003457DA77